MNKELIFYLCYTFLIIILVNNFFYKSKIEKMTDDEECDECCQIQKKEENLCVSEYNTYTGENFKSCNEMYQYCLLKKDIENKVSEQLEEDLNNLNGLNDLVKGIKQKNLEMKELFVQGNFNYLPIGSIIPFNDVFPPPPGWVTCDGSVYKFEDEIEVFTPDLRDRFVLGRKDGSYKLDDKGGEKEVTLEEKHIPRHRHSFSSASHKHDFLDAIGSSTYGSGDSWNKASGSDKEATWKPSGNLWGAKHSNSKNRKGHVKSSSNSKTRDDTSHHHLLGKIGGGSGHNNMPPYYKLIYIMRVKINSVKVF